MKSGREANRRGVFLNVPFDQDSEPQRVALVSALAALGRTPRSVLEVPEQGDGRLVRIFGLMRQCPVSIHDLSRVELPVRFNMPFELGIAFALSRLERSHKFVLLEAKRHRLQKTLSDVNGIDPEFIMRRSGVSFPASCRTWANRMGIQTQKQSPASIGSYGGQSLR